MLEPEDFELLTAIDKYGPLKPTEASNERVERLIAGGYLVRHNN